MFDLRERVKRTVWKLYMEASVLMYVFSPKTRANPMNVGEWLASMVLFTTWGVIMVGISFGFAEKPPHWYIISGVVLVIFGRMWGINLAHQAVGLSPHPDEYRPKKWKDDGDGDGEGDNNPAE